MFILDFEKIKDIKDDNDLKEAIKTIKIFLPSFCHQFFSICKYSIYNNKQINFQSMPLNLRFVEINKINNLEIDSYLTWIFKHDVQTIL